MLVLLNQIDFELLFLFILTLFSLSLSLCLPPPCSLCILPLLSPPLLLTCIALYQPLPLSATGIGEGEGKPRGANGALFQGAPGTRRLWQHQERRHTRADVSKTAAFLSNLFL